MSDNRKTIRFDRQTCQTVSDYALKHNMSFSEAVHRLINKNTYFTLELDEAEQFLVEDYRKHLSQIGCQTSDKSIVVKLFKRGLYDFVNKKRDGTTKPALGGEDTENEKTKR